jgi:hypothetical protein
VIEGFALPEHEGLFVSDPDPHELVEKLCSFERPVYGSKWVDGPKGP